jgi:hypothetical protein
VDPVSRYGTRSGRSWIGLAFRDFRCGVLKDVAADATFARTSLMPVPLQVSASSGGWTGAFEVRRMGGFAAWESVR